MNLRISKHTFADALSLAQSVAATRGSMPILAYVKLTADDRGLTLESTDLEVSVTETVECEFLSKGSVCLDAKLLSQIVKDVAGDDVWLETKDRSRVQLRAGESKFTLVGMPADEFPAISTFAMKLSMPNVSAAELREAFRAVAFAQSTDEARYNLCGVCVSQRDIGGVRYAATDGHRLATVSGPKVFGLDEKIIVPRTGVDRILDFLADTDECQVSVDDTRLHLSRIGCSMSVLLLGSVFPDIDKVIAGATASVGVTCSREDLLAGLRRVRLVAAGTDKSVELKLAENAIELRSSSAEFGEANDRVTAECSAWEKSVSFNSKYLAELLSSSKADRVILGFSSEVGPGVFRFEGGSDFLGVIMPMRVEK